MPKSAQYLPDSKSLKDDLGITLKICQCTCCGLVQLDNHPVPYFKEVIRAVSVSEEMKTFRKQQFEDFVICYSLKGKKVLEVGCGRGDYLSIMKNTGVEVHGIEQSEESVSICNQNHLNVSMGFIQNETDKVIGSPFNAFLIMSFLEHIPDLNSTLRGIYHNLAQDAVGIVEVPNFDMILKKNLYSEFIIDHLFYFTKETLSLALRLNGFEIIECKEVWHDYIISAIVKKREMLDLTPFTKLHLELKKNIEKYMSRFKTISVWGAGHQALTMISMLSLSDKIKYVVDSASFKQGKYTPATHIPIVSPNKLDTDPVDAIIIMAASYSDEVKNIIQKKYGNKIHIAILRDYGLQEISMNSHTQTS